MADDEQAFMYLTSICRAKQIKHRNDRYAPRTAQKKPDTKVWLYDNML